MCSPSSHVIQLAPRKSRLDSTPVPRGVKTLMDADDRVPGHCHAAKEYALGWLCRAESVPCQKAGKPRAEAGDSLSDQRLRRGGDAATWIPARGSVHCGYFAVRPVSAVRIDYRQRHSGQDRAREACGHLRRSSVLPAGAWWLPFRNCDSRRVLSIPATCQGEGKGREPDAPPSVFLRALP